MSGMTLGAGGKTSRSGHGVGPCSPWSCMLQEFIIISRHTSRQVVRELADERQRCSLPFHTLSRPYSACTGVLLTFCTRSHDHRGNFLADVPQALKASSLQMAAVAPKV